MKWSQLFENADLADIKFKKKYLQDFLRYEKLKLRLFRKGSGLSFFIEFWSTSADQSVDLEMYAKNQGKNKLFLRLWRMDADFSNLGDELMHDMWVKICLRAVLSFYLTPMFIYRAIMKYEFWILWNFVILGYFYCMLKLFALL